MQHIGRRFSQRLSGDADGLFMANYEVAGRHLAGRLAGRTVLELCCGIGATTVCLATACPHVIAIDQNGERLEHARRNAELWDVAERITFVQGDALDSDLLRSADAEVVVADPEWQPSGRRLSEHASDLSRTQPSTPALVSSVRRYVGDDLVIRLPLVADLAQAEQLGAREIEAIYIDGQIRFYYAYFGSVAEEPARTEAHLSNVRLGKRVRSRP